MYCDDHSFVLTVEPGAASYHRQSLSPTSSSVLLLLLFLLFLLFVLFLFLSFLFPVKSITCSLLCCALPLTSDCNGCSGSRPAALSSSLSAAALAFKKDVNRFAGKYNDASKLVRAIGGALSPPEIKEICQYLPIVAHAYSICKIVL